VVFIIKKKKNPRRRNVIKISNTKMTFTNKPQCFYKAHFKQAILTIQMRQYKKSKAGRGVDG